VEDNGEPPAVMGVKSDGNSSFGWVARARRSRSVDRFPTARCNRLRNTVDFGADVALLESALRAGEDWRARVLEVN
jgi:hypothetical protein